MSSKAVSKPTIEQFSKYQAAYDYFNRKLFGGVLSPCLLVFREGKKKKNAIVLGHFAWERWATADGTTTHEISLNPETLRRPLVDTWSTLVHEMVHQWQFDHGDPPRSGYHDREWAAKMVQIGLVPSDTGEPGGKQTGQRMTHYIDQSGAFLAAVNTMPDSIKLPWAAGTGIEPGPKEPKEGEKEPKSRNKVKYTCPGCKANCWGKPDLNVRCGECDEAFTASESGE